MRRALPLLLIAACTASPPAAPPRPPAPPPAQAPLRASRPPAPRSLEVLARYPGAPLLADASAQVVAFSADGKLIASGGGTEGGTTVLLWDAATGARVGALAGSGGAVTQIALLPDGQRVVTSDLTPRILLWEKHGRHVQRTLEGHRASVYAISLSPDGRFLASLDADGAVLLWDLAGDAKSRPLAEDARFATALAFSPDGKRVAVAMETGVAMLPAGNGKRRDLDLGARVHSVTFSTDGATLVTGETQANGRDVVVVRDAATGAKRTTLAGHGATVSSVQIAADGARAVSGSGDGTVRVWELATGKELLVLRADGPMPIWSARLSPDGARLAAAGRGRAIHVWNARTGASLFAQQDHAEHVNAIAYSPDGALLASADHAGRVLVRDATTGAVLARLPDQGRPLSTLAFSPDGRLLTVAYGSARLWDPRAGTELARWNLGRLAALTFAPDGRHVAESDDTRVVRLRDAASGAVIRTFGATLPDDGVQQNLLVPSGVAFSPDGRHMAVARWDQDVHVWDVATGALALTLPGRLRVAYSPDGRLLATGVGTISKRKTLMRLRLWDTATWGEVRTIDMDPDARFSPDGALIGTVREANLEIWEVATGELVADGGSPPPHLPVCLAFSPRGDRIATGGADASVIVWRLDHAAAPRGAPSAL